MENPRLWFRRVCEEHEIRPFGKKVILLGCEVEACLISATFWVLGGGFREGDR
jgi:hypothetical protein